MVLAQPWPIGPFTKNWGSPQARGLVGWWPLVGQRATVSRALDLGGGGHHGTAVGASLDADERGVATRLTAASSGVVTVPRSVRFELVPEFTLMAWVRTAGTNNFSGIFEKFRSGPAAGTSGYILDINATGSLRLDIGNGVSAANTNGTTNIETDAWFHVAGTWSDAKNDFRVIVNGVTEGSGSPTFTLSYNTLDLFIGKDSTSSSRFFNGLIADARIYNRYMLDAEIAQVSNMRTSLDLFLQRRRTVEFAPATAAATISHFAYPYRMIG